MMWTIFTYAYLPSVHLFWWGISSDLIPSFLKKKNLYIYFTSQHCIGFCHTLTWIRHGCTISYYKSYLSFKSSFYILDISPLSDMFCKYIFSSLWLIFPFSSQCLLHSKLILMHIKFFSFMNYTFGVIYKKPLPNLRSPRISTMLTSRSYSFSFYI